MQFGDRVEKRDERGAVRDNMGEGGSRTAAYKAAFSSAKKYHVRVKIISQLQNTQVVITDCH